MPSNQRKICIVTGSRSEYGLLYWLMRDIEHDPELCLQTIVTGMHLSPEFGLTWQHIQQDGFQIQQKVEMLLSSDTPIGNAKSLGLGVIGFTDALTQLEPDILVVLGDRFEIMAASQAAMMLRIPIAHIHGGEITEGAIDDAIRHAITKMAHLHFTATETYRKTVIQMGEAPERVFNVGAPGLDHLYRSTLLDKHQLEKDLKFTFGKRNALVTFHPATLSSTTSTEQFQQLLQALDQFSDLHIIFTYPNADADHQSIILMIKQYQQRFPRRVTAFTSLGSLRYLSLLKQVDALIGNSSSGLIEAPSFQVGTINIGNRQKGRLSAESVIHCQSDSRSIIEALELVLSKSFRQKLSGIENPYGKGQTSSSIKAILKTVTLENLLHKSFHHLSLEA